MDFAAKMRCHEYVEALEEERRKIQVFQRELPLCFEIVTQAIEACRQQISGTTTECMHGGGGQSECSEQTSSDGPVLEEFIPLKRASSSDVDDEHHSENTTQNNNNDNKRKSEWLRSAQLWNQTSDPTPGEEVPKKASVTEVKRNGGGAFQPFHREKSSAGKTNQSTGEEPSSVPAASTSSTATGKSGGSNKRDEKGQRKQRRCWSPELHRRFLQALQQLGGSHAATPKQIRELMKVDGLTNDEVKSHLQKYRLHTRRPTQASNNNDSPQAPQFVVVGGIWMPPPEYAAATAPKPSGEAAKIGAANGIHAPMAATAPSLQRLLASPDQRVQKNQPGCSHSEERGSHSEGHVHSNSPATSSSTHTSNTSS